MRKRAFAALMIFAILSAYLAWPQSGSAAPRRPQDVPDTLPPFMAQYFNETQHAAMNSFLAFWQRTPNDNTHRVIKIRVAQLVFDVYRDDLFG